MAWDNENDSCEHVQTSQRRNKRALTALLMYVQTQVFFAATGRKTNA